MKIEAPERVIAGSAVLDAWLILAKLDSAVTFLQEEFLLATSSMQKQHTTTHWNPQWVVGPGHRLSGYAEFPSLCLGPWPDCNEPPAES